MGRVATVFEKPESGFRENEEKTEKFSPVCFLFFLFFLALGFESCFSLPPAPQRILSVCAVSGALGLLLRELIAERRLTKMFVLESGTAAAFWLYISLKDGGGGFYRLIFDISSLFSQGAGKLFSRDISMGPSYSGIDLVVLFAMALIFMRLIYGSAFAKGFYKGMCLLLPLWAFYILIWSRLAERSIAWNLHRIEPLTGALDYRIVLFGLYAFLPAWAVYRPGAKTYADRSLTGGMTESLQREGERRKIRMTLLLPLILICMAAWVRLYPEILPGKGRAEAGRSRGDIVFLDTGIDFSVPQTGVYGLEYAGMFGMLPRYLTGRGYECRFEKHVGEEQLKNCAVLVVLNPMRSFSQEELELVWSFVQEGGAVLAAGDHTGGEYIRLPLNALLRPVGIALNFDSAVPFHELWSDGLKKHGGRLLRGIPKEQLQLVVGASLQVRAPAKVLITGRNAYADAGNSENTADGELGNMRFEYGEAVGDLALAAEASYGKGRFVVFGDTTPFQNTILAYSYPLIDRLFLELGGPRETGSAKEKEESPAFSCMIDAAHLEGFTRNRSGDDLSGLITAVMRTGGMAYVNRSDSLSEPADRNADLIVLTEPALALSAADVDFLKKYMENGGRLILCGDYQSPKATLDLAAEFGFFFEELPLGRVAPESAPEMAFWNACPLHFNEQEARSLIELWGYPVLAYKSIGQGGMYVFADADFFKNKNLENIDSYREGNVVFTEELLTEISRNAVRK